MFGHFGFFKTLKYRIMDKKYVDIKVKIVKRLVVEIGDKEFDVDASSDFIRALEEESTKNVDSYDELDNSFGQFP